MNDLKKSKHEIIGIFEDMQRSMIDGTISQYLADMSTGLDKELSRINKANIISDATSTKLKSRSNMMNSNDLIKKTQC